jgi:hypothetical protein
VILEQMVPACFGEAPLPREVSPRVEVGELPPVPQKVVAVGAERAREQVLVAEVTWEKSMVGGCTLLVVTAIAGHN